MCPGCPPRSVVVCAVVTVAAGQGGADFAFLQLVSSQGPVCQLLLQADRIIHCTASEHSPTLCFKTPKIHAQPRKACVAAAFL